MSQHNPPILVGEGGHASYRMTIQIPVTFKTYAVIVLSVLGAGRQSRWVLLLVRPEMSP